MVPSSAEAPLGLRALQPLERVAVRERAAEFPASKYVVVAPGGGVLLHAREDAGLVSRVLGGRSRPFQIDVFDTQDNEVIKLRRPYSVGQDKLEVSVCGAPAAVVRRELTFFKPVLTISDAADRPLFRVKGPVSTSGECDFELYSAGRERIGGIGKCWSGAARARDGDSFVVRFPRDLDVRYKAAVIGTCFLIDFLIFDN